MSTTVLVGAQWGDEGKGKIIDVLTSRVDWVVRYQGGNNAGHTVEIGDRKYVLHLLPSGLLREGVQCVIGNGVVVDPLGLVSELDGLIDQGLDPAGRLFISDRAHVVFPFHKEIDAAREAKATGKSKIGTTKRGIGPSYGDKAARTGLRCCDIIDPQFPELLAKRVEYYNTLLKALEADPLDAEDIKTQYMAAAERLRPYITDTIPLLNKAKRDGDAILFEGAQGTMLDIDYGTYPYVTSSSATAGGACTGSGLAPNGIDRVIGVMKAYTTRVGEGPFPTELHDDMGELLRKCGNEFGATTGRPRRCGWLDAVVARYARDVNGINSWALTKLDVLDDVASIKVCVAYEHDGARYEHIPANVRILEKCKPVYKEFPGWQCSTSGCTSFDELPQAAQNYVREVEKMTEVPVSILSIGPKRESTVVLGEV